MSRFGKTFAHAALAATLSFTLTISALAAYQPYFPGSCRACAQFAPGMGNNEAACTKCCKSDPTCAGVGQPIVDKCLDCCKRYNSGGSTSLHCLNVNKLSNQYTSELETRLDQAVRESIDQFDK